MPLARRSSRCVHVLWVGPMHNTHILIDPFVLSVPSERDDGREYLTALVAWLRVLRRNRERCSISERSLGVLWAKRLYPTKSVIHQIILDNAVDDFSAIDVINLLRPISETEPFFEEFIGMTSLAATEWRLEPALLFERLDREIGETFRDALVLGVYAQLRGWAPEGLMVATRGIAPVEGHAGCFIDIIENRDGALTQVNARCDGVVDITPRPSDAEADLSLEDLYKDPIRAAMHHAEHCGSAVPDPAKMRVGSDFVPSLEALNIHRQPAILRAVYRRVAQAAIGELAVSDGASLHPVRVNTSADAAQVVRDDGGRLWRCMVTKRGAGYRLHYWTVGDVIELQRVLTEAQI
jgi:hypothetical protein